MNIKKSLPERQQIHIHVRFRSPRAQHDIPTAGFPRNIIPVEPGCLLTVVQCWSYVDVFFVSTFQCTFQSSLVNLAILIVDPTTTPIHSWHPARTAATLEGRQEVDCTRYESGSFRRGSPGSTSGVGSYWATTSTVTILKLLVPKNLLRFQWNHHLSLDFQLMACDHILWGICGLGK